MESWIYIVLDHTDKLKKDSHLLILCQIRLLPLRYHACLAIKKRRYLI